MKPERDDFSWRFFVGLCLVAIIAMLIYVTYVSYETLTLYQDLQRLVAR